MALALGRSIAIAAVCFAAALVWFITTRATLAASARAEAEASLSAAHLLFEELGAETLQRLKAEGQLLSEDPRVKSTLATPGIDANTIRDILVDLRRQGQSDVLAVLTPSGLVQAVVGAESLRGVDVSGSALFRAAVASSEAVSGTWAEADRVLHVALRGIRLGDRTLAFILMGAALKPSFLDKLAQLSRSGLMLSVGGRTVLQAGVVPKDGRALEPPVGSRGPFEVDLDGTAMLASVQELPGSPVGMRLAAVHPLGAAPRHAGALPQLVWAPAFATLLLGVVGIFRGRLFR